MWGTKPWNQFTRNDIAEPRNLLVSPDLKSPMHSIFPPRSQLETKTALDAS
jgi:hypothetical protein